MENWVNVHIPNDGKRKIRILLPRSEVQLATHEKPMGA